MPVAGPHLRFWLERILARGKNSFGKAPMGSSAAYDLLSKCPIIKTLKKH